VPENFREFTFDFVKQGNAEDENPFYTTVNGKVLEYKFLGETRPQFYATFVEWAAGKHFEINFNNHFYDP
jgi:hypothetical protein